MRRTLDNPEESQGSRPVPDPTLLTTQQLIREIFSLKEQLQEQIHGGDELLATRLGGMDKAIELFQKFTDMQPAFVRDQVSHLKDLHQEKIEGVVASLSEKIKSMSEVTAQAFKSVADQFAEKDKAVSVGLSAQKESASAAQANSSAATTKMEENFSKLIDQGRDLLTEFRRNTEIQINDIKSRLDKGEGRTGASTDSGARMIAFAGLAIAAAVGIGEIIIRLGHGG